MNIRSFFYPQRVKAYKSPINGQIKVLKFWNKYSIQVDGLSQSGEMVKILWDVGLKEIYNSSFIIHNSLVLGVGGGTVFGLLNKYYPKANIVGVEIDPVMIEIGKKYFNLQSYRNLSIKKANAINWVQAYSKEEKFDLILVDLYIGNKVLMELENIKFLKNIKSLLSKNGIVIINRLRNKENKIEIEDFYKITQTVFSSVSIMKPLINYLIICYK